jgi:hypothetical protein
MKNRFGWRDRQEHIHREGTPDDDLSGKSDEEILATTDKLAARIRKTLGK